MQWHGLKVGLLFQEYVFDRPNNIFTGIFINIPQVTLLILFGHGEKLDKSSTLSKTNYIRDMINGNFKISLNNT
jgi:hypothetical protein